MGKTEYVGHYGATHEDADNIVQKGVPLPFIVNRLGRGIYFFENNFVAAKCYSELRTISPNVAILEANISVDDDDILDVTHPYSDGSRIFHEAREDFINTLHRDLFEELTTRGVSIDGMVFDRLQNTIGCQMVRACVYIPMNGDTTWHFLSKIPNVIILCVKDASIIVRVRKKPTLQLVM